MEKLRVVSAFLAHRSLQDGNSCAQMRRCIVQKFQHQRVPFEHLLDDAALYTLPAAVDEPHLSEPCGVCFIDVLFDNRRDVSRGETVKVEAALDGNAERVLILHLSAARPAFRSGRSPRF